jgi:ATP-dependent Lon protease
MKRKNDEDDYMEFCKKSKSYDSDDDSDDDDYKLSLKSFSGETCSEMSSELLSSCETGVETGSEMSSELLSYCENTSEDNVELMFNKSKDTDSERENENAMDMLKSIRGAIERVNDEREEIDEGVGEVYNELNKKLKEYYKDVIDSKRSEGDKMINWKDKFNEEEIRGMNEEMKDISERVRDDVSIITILENKELKVKEKIELLEKFKLTYFYDPLSPEYINLKKGINDRLKRRDDGEKELDDRERRLELMDMEPDNLRKEILRSKMTDENVKIVYEKYKRIEDAGHNSDVNKQREWLRGVLSVPFGKYKTIPVSKDNSAEEIKGYLKTVRDNLDENISYLEKPKDEIINFISKFIKNPDSDTVNAISIYGKPGVGKTSLVRDGIAKALNRPFVSIPLGGAKDSSYLLGHGYTYEGSCCGRIIEILKQSKCMNPVIYFDELDKISDTPQGKEIIGVLTHLIDPSQNKEFYDTYFQGIKFDLSKVLFIFSYNDEDNLDSILSDRINKIRVEDPKMNEKVEICKRHLIPKNMKDVGLADKDVVFDDSIITYLINKTDEVGLRELNRKINHILTRINTLNLSGGDKDIIKLDYNKLKIEYPINLSRDIIDVLIDKEELDNKFMSMYI